MTKHAQFHAVSFVLCLSLPLLAQGGEAVQQAFGVAAVDGRIRAGGPGYAAGFDAHGVEFVPVLGRTAGQAEPLRFTLDSVRRGSAVVFVRQQPIEPAVDGNVVRYRHRADLTEVYDARQDGIEQSFVFATRPEGRGDLVVRGLIATTLPLAAATDAGVRYERDGAGGVTFGAVTGIDANGRTARGSIHVEGDHVEWVLPAAFVEHAAYPLVLDPLIGASFTVASPGQVDSDPAVAYDVGSNRYCVVWKVAINSTTDEVRAQLVGPTGTLVGGLLVLKTGTPLLGAPAIANVRATGRFLVTWADTTGGMFPFANIRMVSIGAGNGAVSSTIVVASTFLAGLDSPQVGGDSRPAGVANEYACIVYRAPGSGQQQLECRGVHVTASANPILVGTTQVVATGNVADPSISKCAGSVGNWVVSWVSGSSDSYPYQNVACRVIGAFGVPCSAVKLVFGGVAGSDVRATACATTDTTLFVVAWEDALAGKVNVRPLTFFGACPGTFGTGLLVTPVVSAGTQRTPAIEFAKEKFVLTWLHDAAGSTTLYAKGLDPANCASCGAEAVVATGNVSRPDVVARMSGGDAASDEALVVWSGSTIRGRRFEAVGNDDVVLMGGACGSTGFDNFATYNGDAVLGNLGFELQLLQPTTPIHALIIGLSNVSIPCGPCTLVPAFDATVGGNPTVPLPLPCDLSYLGVTFYTQWLLYQPGGCPLFPDYALSNALKFTIGE
jgi:hypothetical protein